MDKESKLIQLRKEKIAELKDTGVNLYPNDFKPSCSMKVLKKNIEDHPDAFGGRGPLPQRGIDQVETDVYHPD